MTQNNKSEVYIKLPRMISDGMILQRDVAVKIWGWAKSGDTIKVTIAEKSYESLVDSSGGWTVTLTPEKAGGPYEMLVESTVYKDRISIRDILYGDVWICSGQSNMELPMIVLKDVCIDEIECCENKLIRQYKINPVFDFEKPRTDFESGSWEYVNSKSILDFTAVGYFFAKKLFEKYSVPIGLINSSLGGSPAEAWLSEEELIHFDEYYQYAQKLKNNDYVDEIVKEDLAKTEAWNKNIQDNELPLMKDNHIDEEVNLLSLEWNTMNIPSFWADSGAGDFNGSVWFMKEIEIPLELAGKAGRLTLGNIADEDTTFMNGSFVGTTPNQYIPRNYEIAEGVLQEGINRIVVRVINGGGKGGFIADKKYELAIGETIIDLTGPWKYTVGVKSQPAPAPLFIQWKPGGLYNGMIAPMINYAIKGFTWYQGESNTGKPKEYGQLLSSLIRDWRTKWKMEQLPFFIVQLANFMGKTDNPVESQWAELRDEQRKALEIPKTGLVVAIDTGEWNDIHPLNKWDLGERMAFAAQQIAYNENSVVASPIASTAVREGNGIIVSFSDVGSGLMSKDNNELNYFAIAGEDKVFVWARAVIQGEGIFVWNEKIINPVYVRYAWADNPEGANLYNKEGFPASPFEISIK